MNLVKNCEFGRKLPIWLKTAPREASMKRQHLITTLLLVLTALLLVACSSVQNAPSSASNSPEYSLTVDINSTDTIADLETRYGGKVVIWQPEDGYAVLGLNQAPALQSLAVTSAVLETNQAKFWSNAKQAWMSAAASTWSKGSVSAWAGGKANAWSGGKANAWSGGIYQPLPQNTTKWQKMGLQQAHMLTANLGANVKVAVIDSGIDLQHPAFAGGLVSASEMWDFVGNDAVPQEAGVLGTGAYGHGTSVAAIVLQIAPKAKILPLRVLGSDGGGDVLNVAKAINYAVSKGAKIINLSLGSEVRSDAVASAITAATNKGVYVISSSGNTNNTSITFPASDAYLDTTKAGKFSLSVGSVDAGDKKSAFSTYGKVNGPTLEIVGLGEVVYGPVPGNRLGAWSGTSMAAPMVSGAIALALAETLNPANVTPATLTTLLKDRAANIYSGGLNAAYEGTDPAPDLLGDGRLDVCHFIFDATRTSGSNDPCPEA
jgi:thermitase